MFFLIHHWALFFGLPYFVVLLGFLCGLVLWTIAPRKLDRRLWLGCNALGVVLSIYLILALTTLRRTPSDTHTLVFALPGSGDFLREMVMNAALYFPLGLCLSVLIGKKTIFAAFLLSLGIEAWQYFTGSGVAQGTDLIMNTLGAALGTLPLLFASDSDEPDRLLRS